MKTRKIHLSLAATEINSLLGYIDSQEPSTISERLRGFLLELVAEAGLPVKVSENEPNEWWCSCGWEGVEAEMIFRGTDKTVCPKCGGRALFFPSLLMCVSAEAEIGEGRARFGINRPLWA